VKLDWNLVSAVARREFLTTVRRKAFLFMLIGTPAYFAFVMSISAGTEARERTEALKELSVLGVVDSSGLFAHAAPEIRTEVQEMPTLGRAPRLPDPAESFRTTVRPYPDQLSAEAALRSGTISQVLVIPKDYLETGHVRRYARKSNMFSGADRRAVAGWLARNLVADRVGDQLAVRVARPTDQDILYVLDRNGRFELKDDRREMADFMLPFAFSMLLGMSIMIGGQYLLQGVAEEKESRILESLLCTVSAEELMAGKLLGLGTVGLSVVGVWVLAGSVAAGSAVGMLGVSVPAAWIAIAFAYFVLGYLFFGSIMTGIGAVTSNMREGQQFAVWFTFANFAPLIMITRILGHPSSSLAVGLSLFPPTAATSMMLRIAAPSSAVPAWQIALSLALLAGAAFLALVASARVFRVALLMYGKTPNLPEILRWARQV